ncbi:MAG: hypothetical protein AB8G05_04950 [Oligoflexales bacterium]
MGHILLSPLILNTSSAWSKDIRFPPSVIRHSSKSFPSYDGRKLKEWGEITTYSEDISTVDIRSFKKPIVENEILYFIHRSSQKVIAEGVVENILENRTYAQVRILKVKRKTSSSSFQQSVAVRLIQIIESYKGKSSYSNRPLQVAVGGSSQKYQSLDFLLKSNLDKRIIRAQGNLTMYPPYGIGSKILNLFGLRIGYAKDLGSKVNLKTSNSFSNKASLSHTETHIDLIYSSKYLKYFSSLTFFLRCYSNIKDKIILYDDSSLVLEEIEIEKQGYTAGGSLFYSLNSTVLAGFSFIVPISNKLSITDLQQSREYSGKTSTFDKSVLIQALLNKQVKFSTGITHRNEVYIDLDNEINRSFEDTIAWGMLGLMF